MIITLLGVGAWYWNHQRRSDSYALQRDADLREDHDRRPLPCPGADLEERLNQGHEVLALRKSLLEAEPKRAASWRSSTIGPSSSSERSTALSAASARQAEQQARDEVQNRYRRFLDRRKEALFRDTRFTGLTLPTDLDLTRKAAEEALAVFGQRGNSDDWTLGDLPTSLSSEQQTEIKEGCYELLLVLAEATASQGPGQVDRALRVLDSADRLEARSFPCLPHEESVVPGARRRSGR